MFGKAVLGGMIVVLLMSVSPELAGIALIAAPIIIVIVSRMEERTANTAKYGWDPTKDKLENLPQEQQELVRSKWDDKNIDNEVETQQIYRRQFNSMASKITIHRGGTPFTRGKKFPLEGQMPSLKYYENMTELLPPHLANELMRAAREESREYAKKCYPILHVQKENYAEVRREFEYVVDKMNRYLLTGEEGGVLPASNAVAIPSVASKPSEPEVKEVEEKPKSVPKPFRTYSDEIFD